MSNIKKRFLVFGLFILSFLFISANLFSSAESIYGHISYVDGDVKIIREDNRQDKAIVNMPVAPGDSIVTGRKSRCELQFDNGTIMRIDKNSMLELTTVLANTLTSKWQVTTLNLIKGQIYSMNNSYNLEMFQIITPNAAINLKKSSTSIIRVLEDGGTYLFSNRGKFDVLYGKDIHSMKKETIKTKIGYIVTADYRLVPIEKQDVEFLLWNEHLNKNFKELHYGINKLPKAIYRYSKGIINWAEKWSSRYGEWIYNDIFGYVWKPYNETFKFNRPFFGAEYVKIGKELFAVPSQPWGWVPAHLGTWVFLNKYGWTWIPGEAFSKGIGLDRWVGSAEFGTDSIYGMGFPPFNGLNVWGSYYLPTLSYWMNEVYGGYDLYYTYRHYGKKRWSKAFYKKYNISLKKPYFKDVPKGVIHLIEKMNKTYVKYLKRNIGKTAKPIINPKKVYNAFVHSQRKIVTPGVSIYKKGLKSKSYLKGFRDWNPDKRWAIGRKLSVYYSSKTNEVVCPKLKISSGRLTKKQRSALRNSRSTDLRSGKYHYRSSSNYGGGGSPSSSSNHNTGSSGTSKEKK